MQLTDDVDIQVALFLVRGHRKTEGRCEICDTRTQRFTRFDGPTIGKKREVRVFILCEQHDTAEHIKPLLKKRRDG